MNIVLYLACVVVGVVGATDLFGSDVWGGKGLWSELRCCGLHKCSWSVAGPRRHPGETNHCNGPPSSQMCALHRIPHGPGLGQGFTLCRTDRPKAKGD